MKKVIVTIAIVLAAALLLGIGYLVYRRATKREEPLAPEIVVYDAEGNKALLSDYRGMPVVMNFWASWCPPCKAEMPDFQRKATELEGEVQFLMVNMTTSGNETFEAARDFIAQQGYTFPVLYDIDGTAEIMYQVRAYPMTYFIDKDGYLMARATGAIDMDMLEQGIALIYP